MARLDRLGPAKETAQIGSAIGRDFTHALLAAVVRKLDAELCSALDRLTGAGLLFRQGIPRHPTYLFKLNRVAVFVEEIAVALALIGRMNGLHRMAQTRVCQGMSRTEALLR